MTRSADFVEMTGPSPAVSGRSSACGSVSTTWIVTPRRWKKRRIAPRDSGTASAAATAATAPRRELEARRLRPVDLQRAELSLEVHRSPSVARAPAQSAI